jgi:hypothetical protein
MKCNATTSEIIGCQFLIAETRLQSIDSPCWICSAQNSSTTLKTDFLKVLWFYPENRHLACAPYLSNIKMSFMLYRFLISGK